MKCALNNVLIIIIIIIIIMLLFLSHLFYLSIFKSFFLYIYMLSC